MFSDLAHVLLAALTLLVPLLVGWLIVHLTDKNTLRR